MVAMIEAKIKLEIVAPAILLVNPVFGAAGIVGVGVSAGAGSAFLVQVAVISVSPVKINVSPSCLVPVHALDVKPAKV